MPVYPDQISQSIHHGQSHGKEITIILVLVNYLQIKQANETIGEQNELSTMSVTRAMLFIVLFINSAQ